MDKTPTVIQIGITATRYGPYDTKYLISVWRFNKGDAIYQTDRMHHMYMARRDVCRMMKHLSHKYGVPYTRVQPFGNMFYMFEYEISK